MSVWVPALHRVAASIGGNLPPLSPAHATGTGRRGGIAAAGAARGSSSAGGEALEGPQPAVEEALLAEGCKVHSQVPQRQQQLPRHRELVPKGSTLGPNRRSAIDHVRDAEKR